jgi:predicted Zn finger-like uncharacterized protein
MSAAQCPYCGTRFRASQAQLAAFHGMVRCGHCQQPFNALEKRRYDKNAAQQMMLPIEAEPLKVSLRDMRSRWTNPLGRKTGADEFARGYPGAPPQNDWRVRSAIILLALLLLGQIIYTWRVAIAANLPAVKPALLAVCQKLHCDVPLPQNPDLVSIESSEMEADPTQANTINLRVTLRNHARYIQAYPNLELTLTDLADNAVGRRSFTPEEYLRTPDAATGMASERDNIIRLTLGIGKLQAMGYRLYLHY